MRIILAALAAVLLSCLPAAAQDASSVWNNRCAAYGFPQYPQGSGDTFADVWPAPGYMPGMSETADSALDACSAAVSGDLHSGIPDWDDSDAFNASITNWPN